MMMLQERLNRAKPYVGVIMIQFGFAGQGILAKTALNQGMNHFTFSVFRNGIAAIVFAPFAIFHERKVRPSMTLSIFFKIFMMGLLEPVIDQNLYYAGMKYTTATFAIALSNIVPALIFIMAWISGLEKVKLTSRHSQGKILGTIVTVGGAMVMTLIKGPPIELPWTKQASFHQSSSTTTTLHPHDSVKGAVMIAAGCICWACFTILQAITLKEYPAELSLTALICGMGSLQGTILTFAVERGNLAIWSVHWDTKFITALYSGVICSGVAYYVSGVIMQERGPVFVTAFNPLGMVLVAILSSFILSEQLDLGSVIGAIVIVTGLYLVIWGKSKDQTSSKIVDNKDEEAAATSDLEMATKDGLSVRGAKLPSDASSV
ncbi:WAT1-related protein At2g39510 [Daucus carota subsp. sativus]|uniref:WAT1-related protein n=2 Tax=Daucus carota subsp. sativus TaxID=79200 RepID=A0A175YP47_DAUCS|nr:PREDICTED: WAT1-related protein At2g39510-like [Daucus carota subsp. sativus]